MKNILLNRDLKKDITFYCEDIVERQLIEPLYQVFKKKEYKVKITNDLDETSEIGYYCTPSTHVKKVNSKFSIISLGGMDQGKLFWPNFWYKEPWSKFDLGILPGKFWQKMWQNSTWYTGALPKIGVVITGWPKTQNIIKNFPKRKYLNQKHNLNILYAPCFENDEKGINVVKSIQELKVNLLVKHLPWNQKNEKIRYKDIRSNIAKMIRFTKNNFKNNFKIYNSKSNIFEIFDKADLLITDESSLIFESLLFNVPSLSCEDWLMRSNNKNSPRLIKQNKSVCFYTKESFLKEKIQEIILNYVNYYDFVKNKKKEYFSFIDTSVDNIFKLIDEITENKLVKNCEVPEKKVNFLKSLIVNFKKKLRF